MGGAVGGGLWEAGVAMGRGGGVKTNTLEITPKVKTVIQSTVSGKQEATSACRVSHLR